MCRLSTAEKLIKQDDFQTLDAGKGQLGHLPVREINGRTYSSTTNTGWKIWRLQMIADLGKHQLGTNAILYKGWSGQMEVETNSWFKNKREISNWENVTWLSPNLKSTTDIVENFRDLVRTNLVDYS